MSEYCFGVHRGHLGPRADEIAQRYGAGHVKHTDAGGERWGWFETREVVCRDAVEKAVLADIEQAGGFDALRRQH